MTPEGADLISIRGLVEGGQRTPLRKLYGRLDNYTTEEAFGKTNVQLNLTDLEVIESAEPYNFPTATIQIKFSNRANSSWGLFSKSLAQFLSPEEDIKDIAGLRLGLEMEVAHVYREVKHEDGTSEVMAGDVWHVFELEGHEKQTEEAEGNVTESADSPAEAEAKRLLDGKTLAAFNKEVYASAIIRKDTAFQRTITDKSFVKAMVAANLFTLDENQVYHKVTEQVEAPAPAPIARKAVKK